MPKPQLRAERDPLPRSERGFKGARRSAPMLNRTTSATGTSSTKTVCSRNSASREAAPLSRGTTTAMA